MASKRVRLGQMKITPKVDKEVEDEGLSPMSPPDAYAPPGADQGLPYDEMHAHLQLLRDEHDAFIEDLNTFEQALGTLQEHGITREFAAAMTDFFRSVDENLLPHNKREEKELFPVLARRLVEIGEHSKGPVPTTAINVLEEDHVQMSQMAAIIFNFFGLASRLPDQRSRMMVYDAAISQAKTFVELVRLHIFREDNVLFSLAQKHLTTEEFDALEAARKLGLASPLK